MAVVEKRGVMAVFGLFRSLDVVAGERTYQPKMIPKGMKRRFILSSLGSRALTDPTLSSMRTLQTSSLLILYLLMCAKHIVIKIA
jgi:hypothetical protein